MRSVPCYWKLSLVLILSTGWCVIYLMGLTNFGQKISDKIHHKAESSSLFSHSYPHARNEDAAAAGAPPVPSNHPAAASNGSITPPPIPGNHPSRLSNAVSRLGNSTASPASSGYRSVVYFCSWSIYARDHFPADLPVDRLTHILYAFCDLDDSTGLIKMDDDWAATGATAKRGLTGCGDGVFGELYNLKKQNRHLKILISIGGWTYSGKMKKVINDDSKRAKMVKSLVALVRLHSLDGIDVDWEYAENPDEARNYVNLVKELRLSLNMLARELRISEHQFDLTVAAPAGPHQRCNLDIKGMDRWLSFWNLMTYDFSGPWTQTAEYQSNLYHGAISAAGTVDYYMSQGAAASKLVLGMPIYGRGFAKTAGVGSPYGGAAPGTWENGIIDYKHLPLNGSEEKVDYKSVSAYCHSKDGTWVCYDNAETSKMKAQYVQKKGLGGGMWWESSADKPITNERSLIYSFTQQLGKSHLDQRPNNLFY